MSEKSPRGYLEQSSDLTNALILVAPLLVLYQVGLFVTQLEGLNGVDFATVLILKYGGPRALVVVNLLILLGLGTAAYVRRKERSLKPEVLPLVIVESTFYALALGIVINMILGKLALAMNPVAGIVASLGAGVNEELIFRVCLLQLLALPLQSEERLGKPTALFLAAVASSLIFSAAHHVGAGGDPFEMRVFLYRFLAGMIFSGIFVTRGFAVAVYTHAIYDIYVLVILAAR